MMKIKKEITTKITELEIDVEIIKDLKTNKNASDFDIYCIEKTIEKAKKFQKNNIVRLKRTMENNYISWKIIGWSATNIGILLNDEFEKLYQNYIRTEKLKRII